MYKEIADPQVRPRNITMISLLSALQSVFRLFFFYLGMTGAELLDVEVTPSTLQMINYAFLFIDIVGIVTDYGLRQQKTWGYWGTVLLSFGIIIFDLWGSSIQRTTAMGLILPIFFIFLLLRNRIELLETFV